MPCRCPFSPLASIIPHRTSPIGKLEHHTTAACFRGLRKTKMMEQRAHYRRPSSPTFPTSNLPTPNHIRRGRRRVVRRRMKAQGFHLSNHRQVPPLHESWRSAGKGTKHPHKGPPPSRPRQHQRVAIELTSPQRLGADEPATPSRARARFNSISQPPPPLTSVSRSARLSRRRILKCDFEPPSCSRRARRFLRVRADAHVPIPPSRCAKVLVRGAGAGNAQNSLRLASNRECRITEIGPAYYT